ncbi:hypothetical protein EB796_015227 [Bugula neritina]|uniref:G-protein coupled receptors family 1 profile domain-containing protein n=1 Tax=Bugula neritina TaxID=10212 RepID=A0A7J7JM56_BUGNE|nr:hypothetical protein EB796_015227 [Bugula neritina]
MRLCEGSNSVCLADRWFLYPINTVNGISVVLNLLHIGVICQSMKRKCHLYQKIVIAVSVTDVLNAIRLMTLTSCMLRNLVISYSGAAASSAIFQELVSYSRIIVLTLAFFDRWFVLARPYQYNDSIFVRFFWLFLALFCSLMTILVTVKNVLTVEDFCLHEIRGIQHCETIIGQAMTCYWFYPVLFVLHTIFLVLTIRELRKMHLRNVVTPEDKLVRKATVTVLIIIVAYYTCFMVQPITVSFENKSGTSRSLKLLMNFIQYLLISMYGILNAVVYGFMTEGYRKTVKSILCKTKVRPRELNA